MTAVVFTNRPRLIFDTILPLWPHKGPHPRVESPRPTSLLPAESCSTSSPDTGPVRGERGQVGCNHEPSHEHQRHPARQSSKKNQRLNVEENAYHVGTQNVESGKPSIS